GLGTWRNVCVSDQPTAERLVRTALELGINFFDTADSYRGAQAALGRALRGVPRDAYVVSSKVYFTGSNEREGSLSRRHIVASVDAGLTELRTDHIDLLSAHRFDAGEPLSEVVRTFADLVAAGKIRAYGVSEWTAAQIDAACRIARDMSVPLPVSDQPQYSVLWRVPERLVIPTCRRWGMGVVAFLPLAQGVLTGKYRPGTPPGPNTRAATEFGRRAMAAVMHDDVLDRVRLFEALARRRHLTAAQLALAWLLNRNGVTSAIVGASSTAQLAENVVASGVVLDRATVELIDRVFVGCIYDDVTATG
ncbi:MAG TPA: aldo/keto reductase, partial [Aldersonia sp.]